MGLFSFGEKRSGETQTISNSAVVGSFDTDNQSVTEKTSLNLVTVYSCMYVIASSIAQLPLVVLRKKDGVITNEKNHPVSKLIGFEPNVFQTSYKWRETEQFRLLGYGNSYTQIIRNSKGVVTELKPLDPSVTQLQKRFTDNGWRYYYVSVDDISFDQETISLDDVIHLKDVSYDGKTGTSRIMQHADSIGWGLSMQSYGNSFFGSNGRPTGIVSPKAELNSESWSRFKSIWQKSTKAMAGEKNSTMLLPAEVTYQAFTLPPEAMQFLDSRKFSRSEIAELFNVPPHMVGNLEKATFSNISEQALQFVRHTMMPWVVSWEQELTRKLFTESEINRGYYVKFNLAGLLRGTPKRS